MKIQLIILLLSFLSQKQEPYQIDFGSKKKGSNWRVINDGVMGGLSKGVANLTNNSLLFKGSVSLDNDGGFSSLRRSFSSKNLSRFDEIEIRYRSSGISLAFTIAVSRRWYIPNYKRALDKTSWKWNTVRIKLSDFRKHYIGKPLNEMLKKEALKKVTSIGFITDEKKYERFEFEVDYIQFQ